MFVIVRVDDIHKVVNFMDHWGPFVVSCPISEILLIFDSMVEVLTSLSPCCYLAYERHRLDMHVYKALIFMTQWV